MSGIENAVQQIHQELALLRMLCPGIRMDTPLVVVAVVAAVVVV